MGFREKLVKLSEINQYRADQLETVRETWIREVKALYKAITDDWFGEYVEQGYVTVEYRELQYAESEDIFMYTRIMVLNFGGGVSAVLEPIGTNVIGAFGKIELYLRGHKDKKISLLLVREEETGGFHWEVWKGRRQREQILFDRKIFEKILEEWLERLAKV
ncbi:hypothetical protein QUF72_01245 [Desulfobacterales bacterium HSG2]|nr:hypothetical protein [Desulfobacterales bacterium HSG2]